MTVNTEEMVLAKKGVSTYFQGETGIKTCLQSLISHQPLFRELYTYVNVLNFSQCKTIDNWQLTTITNYIYSS